MNTPNFQYEKLVSNNKWCQFHILRRFIDPDLYISVLTGIILSLNHTEQDSRIHVRQCWKFQLTINSMIIVKYGICTIYYPNQHLIWNGKIRKFTETVSCTTYYGQTQLSIMLISKKSIHLPRCKSLWHLGLAGQSLWWTIFIYICLEKAGAFWPFTEHNVIINNIYKRLEV